MERTPILRVRVPDISSARNMMDLLERCCFNGLAVDRGDMTSAVRRHRQARAGTVIFAPELKTGRLPRCSLEYLEHLPRVQHREPPVAFIEIEGRFSPPRVPEDWLAQVELSSVVPASDGARRRDLLRAQHDRLPVEVKEHRVGSQGVERGGGAGVPPAGCVPPDPFPILLISVMTG